MSMFVGADPFDTTQNAAPQTATPTAIVPKPAAPLAKKSTLGEDAREYGWVVGGGTGLLIFSGSHPVLGFLGGATIGREAPRLLNAGERTSALCRMGTQASAIAGSVLFKRHPILGYLAGAVAGAVVASRVPGSGMSGIYDQVRAKVG